VEAALIEQFHFLRPWWLLALVALAWVTWLLSRRGFDKGSWRSVIDPRLLPHVVSAGSDPRHAGLRWILVAVAAIAIVALAGPTWEKRSQSVYRQPSALVVALDLSRSMDAADIKPSRLVRARHKIADILNRRKEGQSALVVYAADAFAVTPLTSDVDTILALLPDLETGLMPAQGSRADRAFERALELFDNSGVRRGDLLLVSDDLSGRELERLESLLERHPQHRISVLAIGTPQGGPIPLQNGGFLKNSDGAIIVAGMNVDNMHSIAQRAGGAFATISADDIDVNTLTYVIESGADDRQAQLSDRSAELWRELGPGLLLLTLPFAALAFRRGLIWMLPLAVLLTPPDAQALDWQSLWRNDDQRALQLFENGEHAAAAETFDDAEWRAAARYRAGDYEAAAEDWQRMDSEDAAYNRATALAEMGRYQDALDAYDRLLQRNPAHADARFNRDALADWLEQQQRQPGQQSGQAQSSQQSDDARQSDRQAQRPSADDAGAQARKDAGETDAEAGAGESWEQSRQGGRQQAPQPDGGAEPREQDQQTGAQAPQAGETEAGADDADLASLDEQMSEQAAQQWLRKIPDDPGGLLRRKFVYQYRRRGGVESEVQPW
jgi:Ca-activated chloride channel family protein